MHDHDENQRVASAAMRLMEFEVDGKTRTIVFHNCPKTRRKLVSMYIPLYAGDEEVGWKWSTLDGDNFFEMIHEIAPWWSKSDDCAVEAYDLLEDEFIDVARCILGAGENDDIDYLDGDCFNLQRDNLAIVSRIEGWPIKLPTVTSGKRTLH